MLIAKLGFLPNMKQCLGAEVEAALHGPALMMHVAYVKIG